jgi:hypothetical protein
VEPAVRDLLCMSTITRTQFELGEPQSAGPLVVFPVLGPEPRLLYTSLARALGDGAFITEVDEQGRVGDVRVVNKSRNALLAYEGEEIQGARQNRTFDAPVLVPAGAQLNVAVSCVEAGRWEGQRARDRFAAAPHTPDPKLRHVKRAAANRSAAQGGAARADQNEVWREVSSRLSDYGVGSASSALGDVHRARRHDLGELREAVRHVPGQVGAVVEISGKPVALDLVGREDVFAELLPRLADGYALQALNVVVDRPRRRAACGFLAAILEAPRDWLPTSGKGDAFAVTQKGLDGSGLTVERELVALSAFPAGVGGRSER